MKHNNMNPDHLNYLQALKTHQHASDNTSHSVEMSILSLTL